MAVSRWSELLGELLETIEGHIGRYDDKIRFRCVCTHFRQSVSDLPDLRQPQPAWLLMPYRTGTMCGLYHPFENKVFDIDLPEAGDKVLIGTSHGWVVTTQLNGSIDVLNPLTRVRVPLPPRYKFPDVVEYNPDKIGEEYTLICNNIKDPPYVASLKETRDFLGRLKKVVLSSSPLSDDFIAVALHPFGRLSYYKAGDSQWRDLVEDNPIPRGYCEYHDVTFFGGKLYVVSNPIGELMICDDFCSSPRLRKCDNVSPFGELHDGDCLTNSSDHVVMAHRVRNLRSIEGENHMNKIIAPTTRFDIHKLNVYEEDTTRSYWVDIGSLGDDEILFMGLGTQILISSQEFTGNGKGNRIYFASDSFMNNCGVMERCFDNGVFDLKDKRVKPLGYECSPRVIWPSPIWFTPNLY